EAAAFFDVPGRAEEALRALQSIRIHATGEHLAGARQHGVVGTSETRDRIQQDHYILLVLDETLRLLDDHLGHLHVTGRGLIEGRRHAFATHTALDLRALLRALCY